MKALPKESLMIRHADPSVLFGLVMTDHGLSPPMNVLYLELVAHLVTSVMTCQFSSGVPSFCVISMLFVATGVYATTVSGLLSLGSLLESLKNVPL